MPLLAALLSWPGLDSQLVWAQEAVVAAYDFDDGSLATVTDSSGHGNDGLVRGASWTSGWYGSSLAFDGNDYVAIPDASSLDLVDELTLTAWVLPTALGGYRVVIDKTTSGLPCNYYLALVGDEVDFGFYNGGWRAHTTAGVNITVNTWYHLAAVYDGVAQMVSIYVNGVEVLSEVETGSLLSNGEELRIGIGFSNEGFVGRIDEVRIFNRALSLGEVGEAMATPISLPVSTTTSTTTTTSTSVPQVTATTTTTTATATTATPTTVTTTTTVTIPSTTSTTSTTLPVVPDAGYALRFFGSGTFGVDQVKISIDPQVPADVGAGDFSLEWWMRVNSFDVTAGSCLEGWVNWIQGNIVFDRDVFGDGDFGDYGISVFRDGLAFGVALGSFANTVCGSTNVADGLWHHVAATRSASNGQLRIYVDGRLDAQGSGPRGDVSYRDGRPTQWASSDPYLVIGAEKHFGPPAFSGWIDEIRISDTVRYTGNFTRPSGAFAPDGNTVALYHLNEGIGTTVNDSSNAPGGPSTGVLFLGGSPPGPIWVVSDAPIFAGLGN